MIKLEHVDKYFGDLHVLKDVNLEVAEGEKLVFTYCPDLQYAEYSMNWVLARAAKKEESSGSTTTK